ncbi:MAG TPA: aminotransferase class III-fold pyridoxal phosphate-dependent enzyme [Cytophagaceae bacterium]|nr:aminotransferase class III-fold pyridoxal phosphate-dependent enzyme [Cytophagaceae bacterium]
MKPFDVYPLINVEPVKAEGSYLWDKNGIKYLDLYGGHAVISIGHTHPHYVKRITEQLNKIAFYSNYVIISLQDELAKLLGEVSGKPDYQLFLCNSGAEANENALKLASFHNGKKKVIAFKKGFHGRTSLAVAATDNPSIVAPINQTDNIIFLPYNDEQALEEAFKQHGNEISSVIIEGIQGVGGIYVASESFLKKIRSLCDQYNAVYIADSVQCGYGRSGKFYSHDYAGVNADIYSMAKGMGNGFPIGGISIAPHIKPKHGLLGTTFGGNHLACAAGLAVLEVMKEEKLMENSTFVGNYLMGELKKISGVKEVRGRGLMIGVELEFPCADVRNNLIFDHKIFTGSSSDKNTMRLLSALNLKKEEADFFLNAFKEVMSKMLVK